MTDMTDDVAVLRRAALEEAARVCETAANEGRHNHHVRMAAIACRDSIRALAGKEAGDV